MSNDADGDTGVPDLTTDSGVSNHYRTLVNAVDDGIYQLDASGRFVTVNDTICEHTGYSREELVGEHVSKIMCANDVNRIEREIRERLDTKTDSSTNFELVVETASGKRIECELRVSPLLTQAGDLKGTVGVVRPLSHKPSERVGLPSIWESDELISSVIDEADVGVFILDDTFDVVWVDETIETYFAVDREDIIGRHKSTVIEETISKRLVDPETFVETVLATYEDNAYVEQFECRTSPGPGRNERWLEHRSKPIESGRYAGGRVELYYDITDRKQSERAHRESEKRLQSLVNAVDEYAIFMLDPNGTVINWNEGARRIKGYSESEILGTHFSRFYTEEDQRALVPKQNLERARREGSFKDETWRVRADGTRFWASVTITAIEDDGELQGFAKVTHDMTERRKREQQLQRERDLVERILETSPVGIAVVNADGTTNRINERMATLLNLTSSNGALYRAGEKDMYSADGTFLPVDERPAARVFETETPMYDQEIFIRLPTGGKRWLSINATPITDDEGEVQQVVVSGTDITDLKELVHRRKQELEEREKELTVVKLVTKLLEAGDKSIDSVLEEFVANLPKAFQYPDQTGALVSIGDRTASTDFDFETEKQITAETSTANGTPITIDVVFEGQPSENKKQAFIDEERELIETLATLLKFHIERREYIGDLQAETRRLEQFAYAASHDLQEPLRMVSSYLQLIERRYEDKLDEDGEEFLRYAVDGAQRMREMIEALLAYSRIETGGEPLDTVNLDAVLEDVRRDLEVKIVETGAQIEIEPLPTVTGDAAQLRQVFQNLLANALEYSENPPQITVSAQREGEKWKCSVSDEGIGIDPEQQEQVFDVFQRLHSHGEYPGTGIGLALCRRIIERHGGEIWVESVPGEGATFSLTLEPAAD